MSLLAEPKRKVAWTLNPRGALWANDESKFGQKMLEKMGWSKGKGLGRHEQGPTEHVKLSFKCDIKGLGFKEADTLLPFSEEYESALAKLNETYSNTKKEEVIRKERKVRHRYHKVFNAKNVSAYSSKDLASIFARPAKDVENTTPISSGNASCEEGIDMEVTHINTEIDRTSDVDEPVTHFRMIKPASVEDSSRSVECLDIVQQRDVENPTIKKKTKKRRVEVSPGLSTLDTHCADETASRESSGNESLKKARKSTKISKNKRKDVPSNSDDGDLDRRETGFSADLISSECKDSSTGDCIKVEKTRRGSKKTPKLCGGYDLTNMRVVKTIRQRDSLVENLKSDTAFLTSNLLSIKGYGSSIK